MRHIRERLLLLHITAPTLAKRIYRTGRMTKLHTASALWTMSPNLSADIRPVVLGSQSLLLSRIFYVSYLWTLKGCLLIYCYLRLPLRTKEVLTIKIAAGGLAASWIACMISFFTECIPVQLYWQIQIDPPECTRAIAAVIATEATNILTDLILMAIPLPILLRPVPPRQELVPLCALYFGGILVIIASFVRVASVLTNLLGQHELIWGQIECLLATVVVNAPVLHGIYRHGCNHIRTWKFGRVHCAQDYELAVQEPARVRNSIPQRSEEQHLTAIEEEHGGHPRGGERAEYPQTEEEQPPPQGVEHKPTRMSATRASLRNSISAAAATVKRLSDQVRSSFDIGGIEMRRELVQEIKHEPPAPAGPVEDDPSGFDIYTGPPPLQLAHVSTQAFGGEGPRPKHLRPPRFTALRRKK
ncbi:uncharacterized protein K444DRAFT_299858 [Hyaloscypha bicolor E]|uniref:Rhodopsin domain-containing protein n=1 Tax=Hyaloscypha bicolor E TaxID=1095630 RepID=A0A2J6SF87_9HELO|nr:uncharacterized protein K444DRAFT_299858 [Hyaloscypha bicolor E]PMD49431.1 hypothetical protein K444DRAFT_299858 [Hyaloscypha bicolor E]